MINRYEHTFKQIESHHAYVHQIKAFDTADYSMLLSRVHSIGVSYLTLSAFSNYLTDPNM